jgi:hypothetical protein
MAILLRVFHRAQATPTNKNMLNLIGLLRSLWIKRPRQSSQESGIPVPRHHESHTRENASQRIQEVEFMGVLVSSIWVDECPSHLIFFFGVKEWRWLTEWAALVWFRIENIGYTSCNCLF